MAMRRAARTDGNHSTIRDGLRKAGASVFDLATVGKGMTDLIVGYHGVNYLIEIKDGTRPPSQRKLTPTQVDFHAKWRGQRAVVTTLMEALLVIGATNGAN